MQPQPAVIGDDVIVGGGGACLFFLDGAVFLLSGTDLFAPFSSLSSSSSKSLPNGFKLNLGGLGGPCK